MKYVIAILALSFTASPAFAGKGFSAKNEAMGFTYSGGAMTDEIEICDSKDNCLVFLPAGEVNGTTEKLREQKGKCELTVEHVTHNHGEHPLGMLEISYRVIKVTKGAKACELQGEFSGKRELTGIYL